MLRFNALPNMKQPKVKYCIVCQAEFKQYKSTEKVCSLKCAIKHAKNVSKEVKLQEYSKALRNDLSKPKAKKKSYKELLQDQVNKLARKIDEYFGYLCIDCGNYFTGQIHGAHFHNVQGNENIRFNLNNIHSARAHCNTYSSEHKVGYRQGLIERYGQEYFDMVNEELSVQYAYLGLTEVEIKAALKIVRKLNREFNQHTQGNDLDGSMMRSYFNDKIGIYR